MPKLTKDEINAKRRQKYAQKKSTASKPTTTTTNDSENEDTGHIDDDNVSTDDDHQDDDEIYKVDETDEIDDFLSGLKKSNYVSIKDQQKSPKEQPREPQPTNQLKLGQPKAKQQHISDKEILGFLEEFDRPKQQKQSTNPPKGQPKVKYDKDDIFSDKPTEVLGKEKRILLSKVKQYKSLFPDELKSFKIKPNPTIKELEDSLLEMEIIVNTSGLELFITDSILQCIKMVEGVSAHTKNYNVSGLSDLLKGTPQFNTLCKQLYIKYNTFSQVPPEMQLIILVATSAYICRSKNMKKHELEAMLNRPMNPPVIQQLAPSADAKPKVPVNNIKSDLHKELHEKIKNRMQ